MGREVFDDGKEDGIVRMGMSDFQLSHAYFFKIDLQDIVHILRKERMLFLRKWLANSQSQGQPEITIFFEAPDEEKIFVVDSQGECYRRAKKMLLGHDVFSLQQKLVAEVFVAYKRCRLLWNKWSLEQENETICDCKPKIQPPQLSVIRGGKNA